VTVADFVKLYEALPDHSSTRAAWADIYRRIKDESFVADRTWIQLQYGQLDLLAMAASIARDSLTGQPLVILNMCDSAQVAPSLAESFIEFFLTRGARAVIGTECSMRPVFADFAARSLLPALFRGESIGEALRQMRASAVQHRNLLGLAYTLFGAADAALRPPILA
jgi:CHAT domain